MGSVLCARRERLWRGWMENGLRARCGLDSSACGLPFFPLGNSLDVKGSRGMKMCVERGSVFFTVITLPYFIF